jgi:hypothetical protein
MTRFNFKNIYQDRIIQIELDMKKAISLKKWNDLAKLKVEKVKLEKLIEEIK